MKVKNLAKTGYFCCSLNKYELWIYILFNVIFFPSGIEEKGRGKADQNGSGASKREAKNFPGKHFAVELPEGGDDLKGHRADENEQSKDMQLLS